MGLLQLFITASIPVLNVLLVTGVGSFLATDRVSILGTESRKHLNNLVFYVFNPALNAANLSQTITMESMALLWFMPINVLLTFVIGSFLGWILIQITKPPKKLRGLVLGCCAAGNLGNILLIIIPAICKENGSPFGDHDSCRTYGLAYVSLSMALGAIFLWSIVYNMVRVSSNSIDDDNIDGLDQSEEHFNSEETEVLITGDYSIIPAPERKVSVWSRTREVFSLIADSIDFKKLFAPSTIGVIIGFFVGLVSPIRHALIGENAPLRVVQESAMLLGDGAIPSVTLIMGGNLLAGLRKSSVSKSIIIGVIIVRYVVLPVIGTLIVKSAVRLGLINSDPLYQFILLLQYAVPPAMNIGTMTQLFGAGEKECSVIFIWVYAIASISLTLWSAFFMWSVSQT